MCKMLILLNTPEFIWIDDTVVISVGYLEQFGEVKSQLPFCQIGHRGNLTLAFR